MENPIIPSKYQQNGGFSKAPVSLQECIFFGVQQWYFNWGPGGPWVSPVSPY